jgi:hypothetical protein
MILIFERPGYMLLLYLSAQGLLYFKAQGLLYLSMKGLYINNERVKR